MTEVAKIAADIVVALTGCFEGFFACGFSNVRQLRQRLYGERMGDEYMNVLSDALGNYYWIETDGEVQMTRGKVVGECLGNMYAVRHKMSIFVVAKHTDEARLFECVAQCLAQLCDVEMVSAVTHTLQLMIDEWGEEVAKGVYFSGFSVIRINLLGRYELMPSNCCEIC